MERLPALDDLLARPPGAWDAVALEPAPFEPPQRPGKWVRRRRWIKRGLAAFAVLFIVLFAWLAFTAPLSKSLRPLAPPRITLLSSNGQPIARNGAVIDRPVVARDLPAHVAQAFYAIEDRRFESHWGVDPRGLARAAWNNARGGGVQGGSTITQQLAKMSFLTPERSLGRKARELLIAFWLEAWLSKDAILERYLSNAYFGDNVYGLRAASLHYFRRQPERLTLSQAAMLAGLVKAPSRLAPSRNLKGAQARSKLVLAAMAEAGFIGEARAAATAPATTDLQRKSSLPTGTYFADWAMPQARALAEASYGETEVATTLDARLQRIARNVTASAGLGRAQVALVAMRPSGEVVAMVGGRSYEASPFNRATQARRQPGSTFKLFVYLAALRSGMTPDSLVDDSAIVEGGYRPKNASERYRGAITLRQAFARSSNVAAVRLYRQLGGKAVIKAARDLGVKSPLADDPSLALGSSGMTLIELTAAYAAIADGKYPVTPRALEQADEGLFGSLIRTARGLGGTQSAMLDLLAATVREGTGTRAALAIPAFGKTGTSQDDRDALFVGFAGDLVVGVWVGNDDNTPLKGVNGGGLPARIWRDFMGQAIPGAKPAAPPPPPKIEDLPSELGIDLGGNIALGFDNGVDLSTELGGVPVGVRIDDGGVTIGRREEEAVEPDE